MAGIILPSLDEYRTENCLRSHHQINRGNPLEKFVYELRITNYFNIQLAFASSPDASATAANLSAAACTI